MTIKLQAALDANYIAQRLLKDGNHAGQTAIGVIEEENKLTVAEVVMLWDLAVYIAGKQRRIKVNNLKIVEPVKRYNKIDGWRGYWIPACAIVGASDTGTANDSPAPSDRVAKEIARIGKEVLHPLGIKYKTVWGNSNNIFCSKRWIVVKKVSFNTAAYAVLEWLEKHRADTDYVHDANLTVN